MFNTKNIGIIVENTYYQYIFYNNTNTYKYLQIIKKIFIATSILFLLFGLYNLLSYIWTDIIIYKHSIFSILYRKDVRLFYFYISCIPLFYAIYLYQTSFTKIPTSFQNIFSGNTKKYEIISRKKIFIKKHTLNNYFSENLNNILQILLTYEKIDLHDIFTLFKKHNTLDDFIKRLELNISNTEQIVELNKDYNINIHALLFDIFIFTTQNSYSKVKTEFLIYKVFMNIEFLQKFLTYTNKITHNLFQEIVKLEIDIKEGYDEKFYIKNLAKYKWIDATNKALTSRPTHIVNMYTNDLTAKAKSGKCDIIIGYEDEYKLMLEYIKNYSNPTLIVGDIGSGKTALIEYLALHMASEEIDDYFKDKRLLQLNIGNLISGSNEGINEIAKKVSNLCIDVINSTNIILVVEDINLISGDLQGGGNFDIINILLSYVDDPNFKMIATINNADYIRKTKSNSTLSKFNILKLPTLQPWQIKNILKYKVYRIEKKYKNVFSIQAINKIIELSKRYIQEKNPPGREINVLMQISQFIIKQDIKHITSSIVQNYFSNILQVNISEIKEEERFNLKNLDNLIHQNIIGQEEAVSSVSSALKRARLDLQDANKPIASFLFLGPTGVGKTELAKTVTNVYFKDQKKMIRIDMSEYQEKKSLSRLIGDEETHIIGSLTDQVSRNPFSLILLDEIEKAHSDIFNLFLQIFDDGYCHDGYGKKIYFNNTIIICTSNAGAIEIQDMIKKNVDIEDINKNIKEVILIQYFKPEFLNRFSKIIFFKPLNQQEIIQITELLFVKEAKKLEEKSIYLKWENNAIKDFAIKNYNIRYGARPIKHAITSDISDRIADMMLNEEIYKGDTIIFKHYMKNRSDFMIHK